MDYVRISLKPSYVSCEIISPSKKGGHTGHGRSQSPSFPDVVA